MERINSSGCVLFRREKSKIKYLLLHYELGHWGFTKGVIEKGENKKETIVREIKEETGIEDIKFIEGFEEKISYFFRQNGKLFYKQVTFYLIETKKKRVELSYEHIGYKWLNFKDAYKQLSFENTKKILKKADNLLKKK